jgi:hypothetical protein
MLEVELTYTASSVTDRMSMPVVIRIQIVYMVNYKTQYQTVVVV